MAHSYFHQFNLSIIGLRFFTVYGPWNRPDMRLILLQKILKTQKRLKFLQKGILEEILLL